MAFTPTTADALAAIHHVVNDYSELMTSGFLVTTGKHGREDLKAPIGAHLQTAFHVNCRKFYEFFMMKKTTDDVLAAHFVKSGTVFALPEWDSWREHKNKQLLHITYSRTVNKRSWHGHEENKQFLKEFRAAWKAMIDNLEDVFKDEFKKQIEARYAQICADRVGGDVEFD